MRNLLTPLVAAAALVLAASPAGAGIDWSYIGDKEVQLTSGSTTITFFGTTGSAANSTGVVLYNLTASSDAPNDGVPDHFEKSPFTLTVSVVDELARASMTGNDLGTITFQGNFSADVTKGSLTNWAVAWDAGTGSVLLGNDIKGWRKYEVEIDGFLPPSPNNPSVNGQGTVHANVVVTTVKGQDVPPVDVPPVDVPPDPRETPEPSSLLLAGLALTSLGLARRRRKG